MSATNPPVVMASLPNDPPSYDYWRVIFRKTYDGKQKSKTFYFRRDTFTKTEVKEWKKRKELDFKGGEWSPWDKPAHQYKDRQVTLQEAIDDYTPFMARQYAKSTQQTYEYYLDDFAEFVGKQRLISAISDELVNEWINHGKVKYLTRKKRKTTLAGFYDHLINRMNVRQERPRFEVLSTRAERKAAKSNKFKDWLSHEELGGLIKSLHSLHEEILAKNLHNPNTVKYNKLRPDLELLFKLVHKTGMRLGDVHAFDLDWIQPDPNLEGRRIIRFKDTPKSGSLNEAIPVMPEIVDVVDRLLEKGKQQPFKDMSKEWISKTFKKCIKASHPDKNMSFRNLRDSAANYWLYERQLPVNIVQQILRHSDITTTMIYVHSNLKEVQKMVWGD